MKLKREIGSEFHIKPCKAGLINSVGKNAIDYLADFNAVYFDSGRSALHAVLQSIPQKRVLLPNYICESVRSCYTNSEIIYYQIDNDFCIDWDDLLDKCRANIDILYLHFFNGYIGSNYDFEKLAALRKQYGFIIIEDTTHSFLSNKRAIGDYCICSLRKWFPISDGGVLYSYAPLVSDYKARCVWADQKRSAMEAKYEYLTGKNIKKSSFLSAFTSAEHLLDEQKGSYNITETSFCELKAINIDEIKACRMRNYLYLQRKLNDLGYKAISADGINQVPMFCILKLPNRDDFRKYLIENCIYCPVHWPLYDELKAFPTAVLNQSMEISIPIDQRYTEQDMDYIVDCIRAYTRQGLERE